MCTCVLFTKTFTEKICIKPSCSIVQDFVISPSYNDLDHAAAQDGSWPAPHRGRSGSDPRANHLEFVEGEVHLEHVSLLVFFFSLSLPFHKYVTSVIHLSPTLYKLGS